MPGVSKKHRIRDYGRAFPASRYDDPRGGRPSALERNILRYRAAEATLYLFYAEDVRAFLLTNIYPRTVKDTRTKPWQSSNAERLESVFSSLAAEAQRQGKVSGEEVQALRLMFADDRKQAKKLKAALGHSVTISALTNEEADELKALLDYRNHIAHRIHLVMSDVSRSYWNSDHIAYSAPMYKGDALDRLRVYRNSLSGRVGNHLILFQSMDGLLFEMAERVFEEELKRLDRLILRQIAHERARARTLNAEFDLSDTELVGDLDPRFPTNHRMPRVYGDDYAPPTGHLTARGVEICYRLFDLGKCPLVVSYLMGISLRAANNRQRRWLEAGGIVRKRAEVDRYDPQTWRKLDQTA